MTQVLLDSTAIDTGLWDSGTLLGAKWPNNLITFSVPGAYGVTGAWPSGYGSGEPTDSAYGTFSLAQATNYAAVIGLWDGYIANTFQRVSDTVPGDIRIAFTDVVGRKGAGTYAYAYNPPVGGTTEAVNGDIWVDQSHKTATFNQGSYDFQSLLHETGHALGLKHPFDAPTLATDSTGKSYDSYAYTVMSYTATDYQTTFTITTTQTGGGTSYNYGSSQQSVTDSTPMVLDIKAIQDLYAPDTTTNTGNDTYAFTDAQLATRQSVWDAGGTDTLDLSQLSRGSHVDLRQGSYSDLDYYSLADQEAAAVAQVPNNPFQQQIHDALNDPSRPSYTWSNNFGIAFGVTIENFIGSAQADTVIGNAAANVFTGGGGADVFTGGGGADIYRDTAANLNTDTINDWIATDIVNVRNAIGALVGLTYSGSTLSFALATSPGTTYTMTIVGASGPVNQRADELGGVDIYFGGSVPAPTYSIAVAPSSVPEGDAGAGNAMTYTVTRTGGSAAATVDIGFGGTATGPGTAGADYSVAGLTAGKLSFAVGAATATFTVTTVPDRTVEPNETVVATIGNASDSGTISTASATGTITNDDRSLAAQNDAITALAHMVATGNVLDNDTVSVGSTLAVSSVKFAGGISVAVPASGSVMVESDHGALTIAADGHYGYLAGAPGLEQFTYTVGDGHGGTASALINVATGAHAPDPEATFGFAFLTLNVTYVRGETILTGPDGVAHDVTGIGTLRFTDGTIVERDGSPLVDDLYYAARYHDVYAAGLDPDQHYAQYGWHEGRDPDAFFSTSGYLAANPDVAAAGINPLQHYDQSGWREGRDPGPNFNTREYLAANPDVAAAGIDPLAQFLAYGQAEGRPSFPGASVHGVVGDFDAAFYLAHNPDVAAARVNPLGHFLAYGWHEGRDPDAFFSTSGYLAANPDVAAAGIDPLLHYEAYGWREGRNPSSTFSTNGYLAANPDVAAAHIDPLQHYLQYGQAEGRHGWEI